MHVHLGTSFREVCIDPSVLCFSFFIEFPRGRFRDPKRRVIEDYMKCSFFTEHTGDLSEHILNMFDVLECENDRDLIRARFFDTVEVCRIVNDVGDLRGCIFGDLDQLRADINTGYGCPFFVKSSREESFTASKVKDIVTFLRVNESEKVWQEDLAMIGVC